MSTPELSRDAYMQGLMHVVRTLRTQNELLIKQNATLHEMNTALERDRVLMRNYCSSINGLGKLATEMAERMDVEEEKSSKIGDSLIMLWGQLAANQYVSDKRQVALPVGKVAKVAGPSAPPLPYHLSPWAGDCTKSEHFINNKVALDPSLTELWCNEED